MATTRDTLDAKTKQLCIAPKSLRRMLISNKDGSEAEISAAIEIQRAARGFLVRKLGVENYVLWRDSVSMPAALNDRKSPLSDRSHISTRHQVSRQSGLSPSTQPPRTAPSNAHARKPKTVLSAPQAAIKIQRFWRRHIDVQVYRYYRDLISFKSQGDPGVMLKCVNPKEAALLDAASGTHIKFRLAGDRFPPNIYYKIFTHRPVQDLCANAPRDYTRSGKLKDMRTAHNKTYSSNPANLEDRESWYKRIENNGWRLVSDRLMPHMLSDPVTWSTHNKPVTNFHHSKLQRRQDVEKARKRKKIDWMKKMYQHGMLQPRTDDEETKALVEGATSGMLNTVDVEGADAVEEWEVDELLDWTTSLNYEDYLSAWKQVGTSSLSEMAVERRLFLSTDELDDYGFNVRASPVDEEATNTAHSRENVTVTPNKSLGMSHAPKVTSGA